MNIKIKVSNSIKRLRKKSNLTQEEFAAKADIDYKYLQRIEGKNPPDLGIVFIEKVAKALNTSPSKLIS